MRIVCLALASAILNIFAISDVLAQPVPPPLPEPRTDHTATQFPWGNVLVAGGDNADGLIASTAVYDWISNTWATAGNLGVPRFLHAATLLPNNQVLVLGGTNGAALDSAELFDPATMSWHPAATMKTPRYSHTATLLNDGRVLVVGGNTGADMAGTAEIYDVASNTWTTIRGPAVARYSHTATLLNSGKVLIAGGQSVSAITNTVETYDPAANSWTTSASLATPRAGHVATLLQDGTVLVTGGYADQRGNLNATAERYDPTHDSWLPARAPGSLVQHTATLLNDGQVLVVGGSSTTRYSPTLDGYSSLADLSIGRSSHTATVLPSGHVFVAGGYNPGRGYLASAALFDQDFTPTGTWTNELALPAERGLDATFASGGVFVRSADLSNAFPTISVRQIVPEPDGGLLALGGITRELTPWSSSGEFALTEAGSLDPAYGNTAYLPPGYIATLTSAHRITTARHLADGALILVSESPSCNPIECGLGDPGPLYVVQRNRPDGTLDTSYGQAGFASTASHEGNAAILSDGTTIALGATYFFTAYPPSPPDPRARPYTFDALVFDAIGAAQPDLAAQFLSQMVRCSPSGTVIPGSLQPHPNTTIEPLVEALPNDQILFAFDGCMLRLNRDATLDQSFGDGGISQLDTAGSRLWRMLVLRDEGILSFFLLSDSSSFRVTKRLAGGSLDSTFGVGGVIEKMDLPFTLSLESDASQAGIGAVSNSRGFPALDANDRVLIAGTRMNGEANRAVSYLARFDPQTMHLDASFGMAGTLALEGNRAIGTFRPIAAGVDRFGRIVVGGRSSYGCGTCPGQQQFNPGINRAVVARVMGDSIVRNVVEFYNASQDHYFITWKPDEIAKLDAGVDIKGWTRTGYEFNTFMTQQPGTVPICRFYIPPELGDSHFFGRDTTECNATAQKFPNFVLEDAKFMYMALPTNGMCPANTTPIYRVFSHRTDANHRYLTDATLRNAMVNRGWLAEGDGNDQVAMCAPQ